MVGAWGGIGWGWGSIGWDSIGVGHHGVGQHGGGAAWGGTAWGWGSMGWDSMGVGSMGWGSMLWGSGGGGSSTVVSKHVGHIQGDVYWQTNVQTNLIIYLIQHYAVLILRSNLVHCLHFFFYHKQITRI